MSKADYENGFESGTQHDDSNILCRENLDKANRVLESDPTHIKDYWRGYKNGAQNAKRGKNDD